MSSLEFEITRSVLLDNFDLINKNWGNKRMGISISWMISGQVFILVKTQRA